MPSGAEQAAAAARAQKKPQKPGRFKITDILGGYLAAKFSKETGMAKYSKLIGTIIGGAVGVGLSWLASRGLATCTMVDGAEVCAIAGISASQITGAIIFIVSSLGTYLAPPNSPIIK